jgi:hypothetical protein
MGRAAEPAIATVQPVGQSVLALRAYNRAFPRIRVRNITVL